VIAIGSNSSSDTTRATEHDVIFLSAGTSNALTAPIPSPVPQVTLAPSQTSGAYRLALLNQTEQSCFAGMNTGRANAHLPGLIYDEEALEYSRATLAEEVGQNSDTPSPLFSAPSNFFIPTGFNAITTGTGYASCSAYTLGLSFTSGQPPYNFATQAGITWYAAAFASGGTTYVNEIFDFDPSESGAPLSIRRSPFARR
jgi:hypothetical protein